MYLDALFLISDQWDKSTISSINFCKLRTVRRFPVAYIITKHAYTVLSRAGRRHKTRASDTTKLLGSALGEGRGLGGHRVDISGNLLFVLFRKSLLIPVFRLAIYT